MSQYQSFPDAAGDSHTLEKLKLLRLPSLAGKRFLDVGCNEGFFCGYAAFDGASRSVGLDASALFVTRAKQRFPACEFLQQEWAQLPDGPFDVILLASALHYADDQQGLIDRLVERLAPDGILVLELGIISSPESKWVKVKRGIDERFFPTMAKVREMLAGYAWKWLGPSVQQDGDPVGRHVIHVSRLRPVAYLMMQPPSYGKSTLAKSLFARAGMAVVAGDEVVRRIATGDQDAPAALRDAVCADYSPFRIDETVRRLFAEGHAEALVAAWLAQAGTGDFALDAYVPETGQARVEDALRRAGYMPVTLRWDRIGAPLPPAEDSDRQANAYYRALSGGEGTATTAAAPRRMGGSGFVDDASVVGDRLIIRGWAVSGSGTLPRLLQVRLGGRKHLVDTFERQNRPDVQRHLALADARCGYVASVPIAAATPELLEDLEVRAGEDPGALGPPLAFSGPLLQRLQAGRR